MSKKCDMTLQVIVLRALRTKLAESLAQVHAAASLLHLKPPKKTLQNGDLQPRLLLDLAKQNIDQCAAMTSKVSFSSQAMPSPSAAIRPSTQSWGLRSFSERV